MVWETRPPASLSMSTYSPLLGMIFILFSDTILWIRSAYTPAAFTTYFADRSPFDVCTAYPSPVFSIRSTDRLNRNSTPFSAAFSASAMVSPKGHTIPPVGACRAYTTSSEREGSISLASSPVMICSPSTPFVFPRSNSFSSPGFSSSEKQRTMDPFLLNGKSRSWESLSIIRLPSTFSFAFQVPGTASNPACTMALFALEVPEHTSSSFSTTAVLRLYLASSLAIADPVTPAPMIITS